MVTQAEGAKMLEGYPRFRRESQFVLSQQLTEAEKAGLSGRRPNKKAAATD